MYESLGIDVNVINHLSAGDVDAEQQATLAHFLSKELIGSGMKRKFRKMAETKKMISHASNLHDRIMRLNKRLVDLVAADSLDKKKKFFQFRLVGVHSIGTEEMKTLNTNIAAEVMLRLTNDVNNEITSCKHLLGNCAARLETELKNSSTSALLASSLSEEEKTTLEQFYKDNLIYNMRYFADQLLEIKTKQQKVRPFDEAFLNLTNSEAHNQALFIISKLETCGEKWQAEGSGSHQPQHSKSSEKKSSRPKRVRRKKSQAQRQQTEQQKQQQQQQKSKGKAGWAKKPNPYHTKQKPEEIWRKKVFVNNASKRDILIPSYVYRTLNLGANFQLASMPTQSTIQQGWQQVIKQLLSIKEKEEQSKSGVQQPPQQQQQQRQGEEKLVNLKYNKNYIDNIICAISDLRVNNLHYINKVTSSRRFRQVEKFNKLARKVFQFLSDNELICILADKNLGLTIVDKSWYVGKMREHFDNEALFRGVQRSFYSGNNSLSRMSLSLQLTLKRSTPCTETEILNLVSKYFNPGKHHVPVAYGLIKLHKTPHKLRIITPVVNWINVKAARDVAWFLQPYVDQITTILPNSMELIKTFEAQDYGLKTPYIASYDVVDMYNRIAQYKCLYGVQALCIKKGWFQPTGNHYRAKKWKQIFALIDWVFDTSYVQYEGRIYKQLKGLPMGSPLSPVLANLYMAFLEDMADESCKTIPDGISVNFLYFRYLDDVLLISDECDPDNLNSQFESTRAYLNEISLLSGFYDNSESVGNIQFEHTGTAEYSFDYVEFLDLKMVIAPIYIDDDDAVVHEFEFELFDKPTNLHIYTNPSTFYPLHYIYNWIQGENIRIIRNSTQRDAWEQSLKRFKSFLLRRNYLLSHIDRLSSINPFEDRTELLHGIKPHQDRAGSLPDKSLNRYLIVPNNGARPFMTNFIRLISKNNNFNAERLRFIPVVKKGISINSVMSKARKETESFIVH